MKFNQKQETRLLVSGKPRMFWLHYKVYDAVRTRKKNFKRETNFFEVFCENYPPIRHVKNNGIDFAARNNSIKANRMHSINRERFLGRIKPSLTRYLRENNRALIVPSWSKCQSLNAHKLTKNDHRWIMSSNFSSKQQYLLNVLKKKKQWNKFFVFWGCFNVLMMNDF